MKLGDHQIEPLSLALRDVVERLRADHDKVTRGVVDMICADISDYTLSTEPDLLGDLRCTSEEHVQLWFDCLLRAEPPSVDAVQNYSAAARRRVHQGVSLDSLLRAFRLGSRALWEYTIDAVKNDEALEHEMLCNVSPYLLQHFDIISQEIAQAYLDEQFQHAAWRDRVRGELWTVISARRDDTVAFARYCGLLNIDAKIPHVALVLRVVGAEIGERLDPHTFNRIARWTGLNSEQCMRIRHRDHLLLWIPASRGESLIESNRRSIAWAQTIVERVDKIERAGVGLPGTGAVGWWQSQEQGFKALESGAREANVTSYSDVALDDAINSSESAQRVLDAMLERLVVEPHLIDTLQAYFANNQHRKSVSSALGVHPNTLDHRLQRIEQLLNGSFDDVVWLATLATALRRRHIVSPVRANSAA